MFKRQNQTLSFPNESRSFDEASDRIRFWAYDGAIEVSFFVEGDAIRHLSKAMPSTEAELLAVFDSSRQLLHHTAERVYRLSPRGSYTCVLTAEDI